MGDGGFALIGALYFAAKMRRFKPPVPYKPFFGEYLLYGAENMLYPASVGLMWLAGYFILYWLFYIVRWLLLFPFPAIDWNIQATGFWITFILAGLLHLIFLWADVFPDPPTNGKLFPSVAGLRSEYYPVYTRQQKPSSPLSPSWRSSSSSPLCSSSSSAEICHPLHLAGALRLAGQRTGNHSHHHRAPDRPGDHRCRGRAAQSRRLP